MDNTPEEMVLSLPWDVIDSCEGIALDIGGSVIKTVYLHKDDWVEPEKRIKGSTGHIRLILFPREELENAFKYVKSRVHMNKKSPDDVIDIFTTGIGGAQFATKIRETFNVKTMSLMEFDCFVHGFMYLMNKPRKQILHELHKPAFEAAQRQLDQHRALVAALKTKSDMAMGDLSGDIYSLSQVTTELSSHTLKEEENIFPCMLVMLGSGFACIKVNEDGKFSATEASNRGGRMFMGLGSLLTHAKTYDELMALCEKGKSNKVSSTNVSLQQDLDGNDDDPYHMGKGNDEMTIFCFGEAVGKEIGDFNKEDLARCLLETMALDLVQMAHKDAEKQKIKHVFFCGGFTSHPVARQVVLREWLRRDIIASILNLGQVHQCQAHFLKQGPFLGAFGAFLNSKLKFGGQKQSESEQTNPQQTSDNIEKKQAETSEANVVIQ